MIKYKVPVQVFDRFIISLNLVCVQMLLMCTKWEQGSNLIRYTSHDVQRQARNSPFCANQPFLFLCFLVVKQEAKGFLFFFINVCFTWSSVKPEWYCHQFTTKWILKEILKIALQMWSFCCLRWFKSVRDISFHLQIWKRKGVGGAHRGYSEC